MALEVGFLGGLQGAGQVGAAERLQGFVVQVSHGLVGFLSIGSSAKRCEDQRNATGQGEGMAAACGHVPSTAPMAARSARSA
ncbi:hypothetical protein GCM10010436_69400 [Paractinoplanes durhamensis]